MMTSRLRNGIVLTALAIPLVVLLEARPARAAERHELRVLPPPVTDDGKVFAALDKLKVGDTIQVIAGNQSRSYTVAQIEIVLEKDQPIEVRRANAKWIVIDHWFQSFR